MLSLFTDPYPDELLYSAFARYHFYSGNIDFEDTMTELFGKRTGGLFFDLGICLQHLCDELRGAYCPEQLIQNHTTLPYYAPFMLTSRKNEVVNRIISSDGNGIYRKAGIGQGNIRRKQGVYYCPACARNDMEKYGETYIHREHHLDGVIICPHHGMLLKEYCRLRAGREYSEYIRLDGSVLDLTDSYHYQEEYQEKLLRISKAAYYLISNNLSHISKENILSRYKNELFKKNLTTYKGSVKQKELREMIVSYYGSELLKILRSEIDKSKYDYNWLNAVTTNTPKTVHPLRHILLILFLSGDMDAFFGDKVEAYNPFGKGPWPCLNPVADHYGRNVITKIKITPYKGAPLGRFTCSCGYVYTRTGPDKNLNDRYRKNPVKTFGTVWEDKFKELFNAQIYSNNEMANQLGCSTKTIKRYCKIFANCNYVSKIQVNLFRCKESVRYIMKENPDLTRSKLKYNYSKEYNYLVNHDKKWLWEVLPIAKIPRVFSPVNWDQLDQELLSQLQVAYTILLNRERPVRVTKTSLFRTVSNKDMLNKFNTHNFPCTIDYIRKISETSQEFKLRKIRLVIKKMHEEGLPLLRQEIMRQSGLSYKDYVLVKDEIENMYI